MFEDKGTEHKKVLLIDLENCPHQLDQLQQHLDEFYQVIICYAKSGSKVPIDWLMPLSTAVNNHQLQIFKMATIGKNAADFGMCFLAGMLVEQLQKAVNFIIISNDSDLDHLVSLLQSQGCAAKRIGSRKASPANPAAVCIAEDTEIPLQIYCEHLVKHAANRPAKQETLLASIKNKFVGYPDVVKAVFDTLITQGFVTFKHNKAFYNDEKIQEFADIGTDEDEEEESFDDDIPF